MSEACRIQNLDTNDITELSSVIEALFSVEMHIRKPSVHQQLGDRRAECTARHVYFSNHDLSCTPCLGFVLLLASFRQKRLYMKCLRTITL